MVKMRKILFRGKRIDNGEWIEGSLIIYPNATPSIVLYDEQYFSRDGALPICPIVPETSGQYTGLVDKNGRKIFEGDILHNINIRRPCIVKYGMFTPQFFYDCAAKILRIKFDDTKAVGFYCECLETKEQCFLTDYVLEGWEIICNIHDNSELLERGTE